MSLAKYITAAAWIWGPLMLIGVLRALLLGSNKESRAEKNESNTTIAHGILLGIPAWAWLLARYISL